MKRALLLAALLAATPATAADSVLTGCYAEGSIAGTFLVDGDRQGSASVGADRASRPLHAMTGTPS